LLYHLAELLELGIIAKPFEVSEKLLLGGCASTSTGTSSSSSGTGTGAAT
jgi:hypothetical protein